MGRRKEKFPYKRKNWNESTGSKNKFCFIVWSFAGQALIISVFMDIRTTWTLLYVNWVQIWKSEIFVIIMVKSTEKKKKADYKNGGNLEIKVTLETNLYIRRMKLDDLQVIGKFGSKFLVFWILNLKPPNSPRKKKHTNISHLFKIKSQI